MMPKVCDEDILFIIISSPPPLLSPPTSHLAVTVCSFNIPKQQSAQDSLVQHLPYSMATLLTANNTTHNAREHATHGNTRTRNAQPCASINTTSAHKRYHSHHPIQPIHLSPPISSSHLPIFYCPLLALLLLLLFLCLFSRHGYQQTCHHLLHSFMSLYCARYELFTSI